MINYIGEKIKINDKNIVIGTITYFDYEILKCMADGRIRSFVFETAYKKGFIEFIDKNLDVAYQKHIEDLIIQQKENEIKEFYRLKEEIKHDKNDLILYRKNKMFNELFGNAFKYEPYIESNNRREKMRVRLNELSKKYNLPIYEIKK